MGPFDIVLSYGGPESLEEVGPFLNRVLVGKPIPLQRRQAVEGHYRQLGGISPLNAQVRAFVAALRPELSRRDPGAEILQANLFAAPLLEEVLASTAEKIARANLTGDLSEAEIRVFSASAFAGPTCHMWYRQATERCREKIENEIARRLGITPRWRFVYSEPFHHTGLFRRAVADTVLEARAHALLENGNPMILFSAHALPEDESRSAGYRESLLDLCSSAAERVGLGQERGKESLEQSQPGDWALVFQSGGGSPARPWTGPTITEALEKVAAGAVKDVLVIPVGFFFENTEIAFDLDIEAASLCRTLGLSYRRGKTVGLSAEMLRLALEFFTPWSGGTGSAVVYT